MKVLPALKLAAGKKQSPTGRAASNDRETVPEGGVAKSLGSLGDSSVGQNSFYESPSVEV
jgi:hypothetical protein